jgi:antitoxin ParD1/3/4
MPSSYVIGEHFERFIKNQIQQGRYASASEVIRDGLRSLEDREKFRAMKLEALRAAIQKGADSGAGIPAEEVFDRLKAEVEAKLLEGLSSAETELTPADWSAMRGEALAKVEARKQPR